MDMRDAIAHADNRSPRNFGMRRDEIRRNLQEARGIFAHGDEAHRNRVLEERVHKKIRAIDALHERQPRLAFPANLFYQQFGALGFQIGRASASTRAQISGENSRIVTRSTPTPNSAFRASNSAPRSNN